MVATCDAGARAASCDGGAVETATPAGAAGAAAGSDRCGSDPGFPETGEKPNFELVDGLGSRLRRGGARNAFLSSHPPLSPILESEEPLGGSGLMLPGGCRRGTGTGGVATPHSDMEKKINLSSPGPATQAPVGDFSWHPCPNSVTSLGPRAVDRAQKSPEQLPWQEVRRGTGGRREGSVDPIRNNSDGGKQAKPMALHGCVFARTSKP